MVDENDAPARTNLADSGSLLGMLQRGRGEGYLRALAAPPETVWPLLFECITNDPRLDRQCEEREEYYASLILARGMDVEPLGAYLRRNDTHYSSCDCCLGLVLGTLACLAYDNVAALKILREYTSYGRRWEGVLHVLADVDTFAALDEVIRVLCRRINSDVDMRAQFERAVHGSWKWYCWHDADTRTKCEFFLPICEPWRTLCEQNSEFAHLFDGVGINYDQPSPPREKPGEAYLASLSLEDLFARVNDSNRVRFWRVVPEKVSMDHEDYLLEQLATGNPDRMILAFGGLGKLGTPRAFDTVRSYIEASENADPKVRRYAFTAIEQMPGSLTLETARRWFRRKEWYLHVAAGGILENHATVEDVPLLIEALRQPETLWREDFRLPSALDALTRFAGIGPIPELEQAFCEVPHSFDRCRAAAAMAATAPVHFTAEYAFECLWDCDSDTRALGCEMVSLSMPGALERLKELAADLDELDNIRQEADERLEGF